jgi:hypothetical protein
VARKTALERRDAVPMNGDSISLPPRIWRRIAFVHLYVESSTEQ